MMHNIDRMDLHEALRQLSARDMEIVVARSYGLPFSQIGRELGCSGETAGRRYERALHTMRNFLERKPKPAVKPDPEKIRRLLGHNNTCPTCGR